MSSVMYTPSPSNRGSSSYSSRSSAQQKTQSVRAIAGLWTFGFICYGAYFSYQLVALLAGGMSGIGTVLTLVVSTGSMSFLAFLIFKAASGRGVRVVTYLCMTCVAISAFLIPGFAGLITVISVVGGVSVLMYIAASHVVENKVIAVVIASLPIVGAVFYVPTTLVDAGVNVKFSQNAPPVTPSPIAPQLSSIAETIKHSYAGSAVLSYSIRSNRLYADICKNGAVESVELDTKSIVQTPIPWLQWNLSKRLDRYLAAGDSSQLQLASLLAPVRTALSGLDTVMVADGALLNHPQRSVLAGKRVFRSVSLDQGQIGQNIQKWAEPVTLSAADVAIVNGIPANRDELERLDITGGDWNSWSGVHGQFEHSIPRGVVRAAATKSVVLDALQTKKGVMFIVAHSDGFSIRLPNGETISVKDFDAIQDAIRRNRPRVFLFSCETARVENTQSFAKALLDHGAEAVVAPTTRISTSDALGLFRAFLNNALGPSQMPIGDAFQKAQTDASDGNMEVWVARSVQKSNEADFLSPEFGGPLGRLGSAVETFPG